MTERAFVDTNIVIYATGAESPAREPSRAVIRAMSEAPQQCWSSAEVLQELLHVLLRRGSATRASQAIGMLLGVLRERVVALQATDVVWCLEREFPPHLQARDRVHLAVMNRLGITHLISADVAFDAVPGVTRLDPANFETWRELVFGQ